MENEELMELARERIASEQLPLRDASCKIFGGKGTGKICSCCSQPISTEEVEYDVVALTTAGDTCEFSMHLRCLDVWSQLSRSTAC